MLLESILNYGVLRLVFRHLCKEFTETALNYMSRETSNHRSIIQESQEDLDVTNVART